MRDIGEEGFIEYLKAQFQAPIPLTGIGDDAAVIPQKDGTALLVTTDALVEGVHFIKDQIPPKELGYKAVAINVSDIAAMGGLPESAFLTLALPKETDSKWVKEVMKGFKEALAKWNIPLLGGDTVGSKKGVFLSVTLLGFAPSDQIKWRKGAQNGDVLFVTGFLGDSGAGLKALKKGLKADRLIKAHFHPNPSPCEGRWLAASTDVHALMDISDGLDADLDKMLKASSCGAKIDVEELPLSKELLKFSSAHDLDPTILALTGGEDYCLLGAMAKEAFEDVSAQFAEEFGRELHKIGTVKKGALISYFAKGKAFKPSMIRFDHFR